MSDKTAAEKKSIFAITNLDAEDLGSSIIATYCEKDEAYQHLENLENPEHEDYAGACPVDVFEIELPKEMHTTSEVTALITKVLELAAKETSMGMKPYTASSIKQSILNTDFKHLLK